jgi:hypothetical protein
VRKPKPKWELPEDSDWNITIPCPQHPNRIRVSLKMCLARTKKPDIYKDNCRGCEKWDYFRDYKPTPRPKPKKEPS